MEKINDVFDKRIDLVCDNYSSVFTKDDVISLISGLRADILKEVAESVSQPFISEMDFQEFSAEVTSRLDKSLNNGDIDICDYSSAEFSIDYHNTIQIENIDFNSHNITDELSNILLDAFQLSFGEFITSETE